MLILDEPTNHLDISSKEVLENALAEYTGTIIFVSHDRYLLNKIATRIVEVKNGEIHEYKGNYDDYLIAKELEAASTAQSAEASSKKAAKNQYRTKSQRAEDVKRKQEIKELEARIEALEAEIKELEELICQPEIAADYQKMGELCANLDKKKADLSIAMDEWLEKQE